MGNLIDGNVILSHPAGGKTMRKNWDVIKDITTENMEYYHMLSGIYSIAMDFRCVFTPEQKDLIIKLYALTTAMNLHYLEYQISENMLEPTKREDALNECRKQMKKAQETIGFAEDIDKENTIAEGEVK